MEEKKQENPTEEVYMKRTGFEVIGVKPIPETSRYMTAPKVFIFWAMASASATTPLIGYLLENLGLVNLLLVFTISLAIGLVPAGLFSEMGRQFPVPALVVSRKTYGYLTSNALSALYTIVNIGWFGLNDSTGGLIVASLLHSSPVIWYLVFGAIQIVLVLYGARILEYFYRYTAFILVVCYAVLTYFLIKYFPVNLQALLSSSNVDWGASIGLVLAFSLLSWTYKISTATRFAKPYKGRSLSNFVSAPLGIMVPVYLMGVLGFISQKTAGNWNLPAVSFPVASSLAIIVGIASVGAALAILHTNAMNLYPAVADLITAIQPALKRKWEHLSQPVSTVFIGLAGAIAAVLGILQNATNFLNFVGDIIFPYTFIVLLDWYLRLRPKMQEGSLGVRDFYQVPRGLRDNVNLYSVLATVVGTALNVVTLPGLTTLYLYFPQDLFGSLIGALLYFIFLRLNLVR
ncbi:MULTISPECIES: purine-cytosine permease family protein [Metallosphaera]|uniref:Permease for cytosine/purine, uracil, thiamine, allantoin n=3 Tax=Metallosphaera TaxID=41980 RepID=A4YFU4_METS5|nr:MULTISPECIES: cytosine permease [Metallosphaera]ABP95296.1 permease for cytosine/purine, uracil, thiamine, allantoin [Metallosphaera sedula DSM 5348]AIM27282.1 permease for cytosine/purine, uracil, thiamine, allantoin [Metallosphaera sedula]AKV74170.1 purine-cytosine permease [Metallosphaera sedula]AKV76409.1 purine-cytosine permease [Metallosphaera sedula]AKV78661.1 purine-cytosine permease [Metallosphaera sedula]